MEENAINLIRSGERLVGFRQTRAGIANGTVKTALLACDADADFAAEAHGLCARHGVPCVLAGTKAELGRECGIDVAAAIVGIIKGET
jgi:large subunit ribosomal protein L7A